MDNKTTLADVYRLAAAEHGYDSLWTFDGKQVVTLADLRDSAETQASREDRLFRYDGMRVIRHGEDVQDWTVVIYRADARCATCGVFVEEDLEAYNARHQRVAGGETVSSRCIGCMSGGVIHPGLFRKRSS